MSLVHWFILVFFSLVDFYEFRTVQAFLYLLKEPYSSSSVSLFCLTLVKIFLGLYHFPDVYTNHRGKNSRLRVAHGHASWRASHPRNLRGTSTEEISALCLL